MKQRKRNRLAPLLIVVLIGVLAGAAGVQAQAGGGYSLTWNTIDNGGLMSGAGGSYSLGGTIGQPEAGAALAGGDYTLTGGFWTGVLPYDLYVPLILK